MKVQGSPVWPLDGAVASALIHSWAWAIVTGFGWSGKGDERGLGVGGATFEGALWINANDTLDNFCQQTARLAFDWVDVEGSAVAIVFSDGNGILIGGATLVSEGIVAAVGMARSWSWSSD